MAGHCAGVTAATVEARVIGADATESATTTGNPATATTIMGVTIDTTIAVTASPAATTTATSSATATATTITITITATGTIATVDCVTRIQLFYQGRNPGLGAR